MRCQASDSSLQASPNVPPVCAAKRGEGAVGGSRGPAYPIESVDNALRLLIMVAEQKQVRVSEAASDLGTAVSTAHRLLAMLAHYDLAVQDPESKVYKAGPVLLKIGLSAAKNLDARTLVRPFAESLRDEVGETVHVVVLQGKEVLFVDCAESPNALRVASRTGTVMWAHCTSVGKAMLAAEPPDAIKELYKSAKLPSLTEYSITQRSELLAQLEEVKRQGYARNANESEMGVGSVSAAVHDRAGRAIAGISISAPLVRMPPERWPQLAEAVVRTARAIEASVP